MENRILLTTLKSTAKAVRTGGNTIFHIAEEYLSMYYKFRFNTIALDIE